MSACFLLDVNALVAMFWPAHAFHDATLKWFAREARREWATCPFTQAGFVRIISNPAFSRDAVTPEEAARVLSANLEHRFHRFWPDAIGYVEAVKLFEGKLTGHRQITDAYLLGLAIQNNGKLATLDRAIPALLPRERPHSARIEMIVGK